MNTITRHQGMDWLFKVTMDNITTLKAKEALLSNHSVLKNEEQQTLLAIRDRITTLQERLTKHDVLFTLTDGDANTQTTQRE